MPNRYTTYLIVVPTSTGKLRLQYGHPLDAPHGRTVLLTGPEPVLPPDREFTEEELKDWRNQKIFEAGFSLSGGRPMNPKKHCPIIEVLKTIEEQIPKGSIEWAFAWLKVPGYDDELLTIRVVNRWNLPIPDFSMATAYEAEQTDPSMPAEWGAVQTGGSDSAFRLIGPPIGLGSLYPTIPAVYALDPPFLSRARSRVDVLSPEDNWIELRTAGYEFDRIPSNALAAFLDSAASE